jgi:hypothetical protein
MEPLDVYVLGAGASSVHGAPVTDQILPYALTIPAYRKDRRLNTVRSFLREVFNFDSPARRKDRKWKDTPGLVDVLSMADMAIDRKENLSRTFNVERLRHLRSALEFAIFLALENSLSRSKKAKSKATKRLVSRLDPKRSAIISFNYDIVVDVALARQGAGEKGLPRVSYEDMAERKTFAALRDRIDYGVEFANLPATQGPGRFRLFKLHGSLNWLHNTVSGDLYYGGLRKAVGIVYGQPEYGRTENLYGLFDRRADEKGREAAAIRDFEPILVTPTQLKDLRNTHLARIWQEAERTIRRARSVTFVGYSLPGDDLHVKYLFKRAVETRRPGPPNLRITVVDKGDEKTSQVKRNYERFFGKRLVTYYGGGFDAWLNSEFGPAAADN